MLPHEEVSVPSGEKFVQRGTASYFITSRGKDIVLSLAIVRHMPALHVSISGIVLWKVLRYTSLSEMYFRYHIVSMKCVT